eukprot:scaffold265105_cov44-Tisochrysis_lutea.AAC.1
MDVGGGVSVENDAAKFRPSVHLVLVEDILDLLLHPLNGESQHLAEAVGVHGSRGFRVRLLRRVADGGLAVVLPEKDAACGDFADGTRSIRRIMPTCLPKPVTSDNKVRGQSEAAVVQVTVAHKGITHNGECFVAHSPDVVAQPDDVAPKRILGHWSNAMRHSVLAVPTVLHAAQHSGED